jgi:hypothetical protein
VNASQTSYVCDGGGANGNAHFIGESYGGGVVFQLWKDNLGNEHGLIVDIADLSASQSWCYFSFGNTLIGAGSSWDGASNSNAIVSVISGSSAAKLCVNSSRGGMTGWYLPSIDEMSLLWNNRYYINKTLSTISGATLLSISNGYWTSNEYDQTHAWFFDFRSGAPIYDYNVTKPSYQYVRAIRAF